MPVEHQARAAAGAGPGAEHVRAALLDLLPGDLEPELGERRRHQLGHRLLAAGEARGLDRLRGEGDEALLVDRGAGHQRTCGSTVAGEEVDLLEPVLAPELEHDVGAAGLAVGLDRGDAVGGGAGDRPAAVEQGVADRRLRGEPPAALHRLGDRRELRPSQISASSSSVSAEPRMFWNLLARYMPAISRAPSRPASRSEAWIEATIVQPRSTSAGSRPALAAPRARFSRV